MSKSKRAVVADDAVIRPWSLPAGWEWKALGGVADINPKTTLPAGGEVSFVPMQAVEEETFRIDVSWRRAVSEVARNYTRFSTDDVLFAKITPCMENGKIAVVPKTPERVLTGSTEFHILRPRTIEPRYLALWLSRLAFRNDARHNMTGTAGQRRVPASYLRDSVIPVPDREAQKRVVYATDELLSEVDDGETALARAQADLEVYRRSLLKAAVTGELTADWRAANPIQETGPAFLTGILADRRKRWHADISNKGKRYIEPAEPSGTNLPSLPADWAWATMEQLSWTSSYGTSEKCSSDANGTPVFRIPNIRRGTINSEDLKFSVDDLRLEDASAVDAGDLLIVRTNGSEDLIGRAALVLERPDRKSYFASYLIRFRLLGPQSLFRWIALLIDSVVFRSAVRKSVASSAGQYNLSMSKIEQFALPIPPLEEIKIALSRWESVATSTDDGAELIETSSSTSAQLRQSILAAAFRGELAA